MASKTRQIEVDVATAEALETEARARGLSLQELLSDIATTSAWPEDLETMRKESRGPWSPEVIAADVRAVEEFERTGEGIPFEEVKEWMNSWGTEHELPMPKPRKL
jgi:hypothetical protein